MGKLKYPIHNWTGNAIGILALASFIGMFALPEPYGNWSHFCFMVSIAATLTLVGGGDKLKPMPERLKNAVVTCAIIAGFVALTYGMPSYDYDSQTVRSEGFRTTFDSKAGFGVRLFLKLFLGASIGIFVAEMDRKAEPDED